MDATGQLPSRIDWPPHEQDLAPTQTGHSPEFADVAEFAPFEPAGRWTARHTRWAGLAAGALALLVCLAAVVRSGSAGWAFVPAGLGLALAVAVSRGLGDAGAGSVYASAGLASAFVGGALLPGDHLLLAGVSVLAAALLGLVTAAGAVAPLVTGVTVGLFAIAGSSLPVAVLAGAGLVALPWLEVWAAVLARLPVPVASLAKSRRRWASLVRADGLATGMTVGIAAVALPCEVVLVRAATLPALVLVALLAAGLVLRAIAHRTLASRLALLVAGGAGVVLLAGGPAVAGARGVLALAGPGLVGVVALVVLAGLLRSLRTGTAGNWALVEAAPLVAVVPAVYAVLAW